MARIIKKENIKGWLKELKDSYKVVDIRDDILPPKQYFFPPKEKILKYNKKKNKLSVPKKKENSVLLFGLDLLDLEALTQLDEIMRKPKKDYYYWKKREDSVLVGISDESIEVTTGGDLVLMKVNPKEYEALVFTEKGKKILNSNFFKKRKSFDKRTYPLQSNPLKDLLLNPELLKDAILWSKNHKIWKELGRKCLGCGICTYVCPLCYCFSMEDRVHLGKDQCSRCRMWDACTLPRFAKVAGGHDFHPDIKSRYYNWYYHKFVRGYKEYGKSQCVACGRCFRYCPAGINILEVLNEIVEDYKKKSSK